MCVCVSMCVCVCVCVIIIKSGLQSYCYEFVVKLKVYLQCLIIMIFFGV